ncbi:unnamed protein product, partial [Rotaria magnacalcarata]
MQHSTIANTNHHDEEDNLSNRTGVYELIYDESPIFRSKNAGHNDDDDDSSIDDAVR